MKQQINLYQECLIDKPEPLLLPRALGGVIVAAVVLALIGGYGYWRARTLEDELLTMQQREHEKQALVAELELKFPERQPNPLLAEKAGQLEKQVAGQKDAISYFSRRQGGGNDRILRSLQGLSAHRIEGLWLTRISLGDEGQTVEIFGATLDEEKIPAFVATLGEGHVFGGAVFNSLTVTRLEEPTHQVTFELAAQRSTP